jgi:hypothetical protein
MELRKSQCRSLRRSLSGGRAAAPSWQGGVQSCRSRRSGHYAYYGITGNSKALSWFRYGVVRCWRKWLKRRNRERSLDWGLFNRLLARYPLPLARVVHSVYAHAASP